MRAGCETAVDRSVTESPSQLVYIAQSRLLSLLLISTYSLTECLAAGVSARPTLHNIAQVVGMAEGTIQGVYMELLPYKARFVPLSVAKQL